MRPDGRLLSVNIAHVQPNPYKTSDVTGIDKRPTLGPVAVTAPRIKDGGAGSGLGGEQLRHPVSHVRDDQDVYPYAREDLDRWQLELDRTLASGSFRGTLTAQGLDGN